MIDDKDNVIIDDFIQDIESLINHYIKIISPFDVISLLISTIGCLILRSSLSEEHYSSCINDIAATLLKELHRMKEN